MALLPSILIIGIESSRQRSIVARVGGISMSPNGNSSASPEPLSSEAPQMALSIRQPFAEFILRGLKTIEYRSLRTKRRGRVYIYASKIPGDDAAAWAEIEHSPGELPTGMLVGTVEIIGCVGEPGAYHWMLAKPERLCVPIKPTRMPQPMFFTPF